MKILRDFSQHFRGIFSTLLRKKLGSTQFPISNILSLDGSNLNYEISSAALFIYIFSKVGFLRLEIFYSKKIELS